MKRILLLIILNCIVLFPHTYTIVIDSYKFTQEIIREGTIYGY